MDNLEGRQVDVFDVRGTLGAFQTKEALDHRGFMHHRHASNMALADFYDNDKVMKHYYPETAALVQQLTGASKVIVFDHVLRISDAWEKPRAELKGRERIQGPASFCHNDYTERSAPQRVLQLSDPIDPAITANTVKEPLLSRDEAERLVATHRVAFINVWRSVGTAPVRDNPLAICDQQSFGADDFVNLKFLYPDREGEIKVAKYSPTHRWLYVSEMTPEEVLLLKCYDSALGGVPSAHTGFSMPKSSIPPDCPPRESVEMRTVVFWPEKSKL